MDEDAIRAAHNYLKEYRAKREFAVSQEMKAQSLYDILFEIGADAEDVECAFAWLQHNPGMPNVEIIKRANISGRE